MVGNRHVVDGEGRPVLQVMAWDRTGEVVDTQPPGQPGDGWPVPGGLNDRGQALVDDWPPGPGRVADRRRPTSPA